MIAAVRRQGIRPSGATPASAATSSPQAPAALTTTGARNTAPAVTCDTSQRRRAMRSGRRGCAIASTPPAARNWRRKPWWIAATSRSQHPPRSRPRRGSRAATPAAGRAPPRSRSARCPGRFAAWRSQRVPLILRRQEQHRALADQRLVGEARRRLLQEGARQAGEHARRRAGRSSGSRWRRTGRWCGSRAPPRPRSARRGGRAARWAAAVAPAMPAPMTTTSKSCGYHAAHNRACDRRRQARPGRRAIGGSKHARAPPRSPPGGFAPWHPQPRGGASRTP